MPLDCCPICEGRGRKLSDAGGAPMFLCPKCCHRWQPHLTKNDEQIAKEVTDRNESTSPAWVFRHIPAQFRVSTGVKILDIGCWEGDILANLPGEWDKTGVELNPLAAERARGKGINVLTGCIEDVDIESGSFDIILLLDVLEHLPNPIKTLERSVSFLRPGGCVVCMTGAGDCLGARVFRQSWYYCQYAEHISFFSKKSIDVLLSKIGLELTDIERISHPTALQILNIRKVIRKFFTRRRIYNDGLRLNGSGVSNIKTILSRLVRRRDHYFFVGVKR